jgi:hypothetical protein
MDHETANRIFEVGTRVTYRTLQDLIDQKYGQAGMILQFIDNDEFDSDRERDVVIDSDYVLKLAISKAVKD